MAGTALVLAGCGGGDGGSELAASTSEERTTGQPEDQPAQEIVVGGDVLAGAPALEARLGSAGGASAVLFAVERGYASADIVSAAASDALAADGTILDESGVLTPSGPPAGVVALPEEAELEEESSGGDGPVGFRAAPARSPGDEPLDERDVQELLGAATDRIVRSISVVDEDGIEIGEAAVIVVILGLVNTGYSLEQIVDFLVLGGQGAFTAEDIRERPGSVGCIVLATADEDAELVPVRPARGLNENCAFDSEPNPTTTAPAEETVATAEAEDVDSESTADVVGSYFGTATVTLSFPGDDTFDGTECTVTPEVELTLGADNSAMLTVVWTNYVATPPQPAGEGCAILDAVYDVPTVGTWSGDQVDVTVRTPRRGLEAPIIATIGESTVTVADAPLAWTDRSETGTMNVVLERVDD